MTISNITRPEDFTNVGYLQQVFFIFEKQLVYIPYLPDAFGNVAAIEETEDILIEAGVDILELYFTPKTAQYSESSDVSKSGKIYTQQLVLEIPKDQIATTQTIQAISNNKLFIYYLDRNGKFKLLRNMVMTSVLNIAQGNKTQLTFEHQSLLPAKFVDIAYINTATAEVGDSAMESYENAAQRGRTLRVEDYPWLWIYGEHYNTYKGNTFQIDGDGWVYGGNDVDYAAVTNITLSGDSLTTDFVFLDKFNNLTFLDLSINDIDFIDVTSLLQLRELRVYNNLITEIDLTKNVNLINFKGFDTELNFLDLTKNVKLEILEIQRTNITMLDLTKNENLTEAVIWGNSISFIDISNCILLEDFNCRLCGLTDLDISNNPLLINLKTQSNELDNLVNSQLLIGLDNHGLSNGYFQSSIFGGGSLTTAGSTAKTNLQAKGWTIVGL